MTVIEITQTHALGDLELRRRIDALLAKLQSRFGGVCRWCDDRTAQYERSGIDARVHCRSGAVTVTLRLGLMMLPLRGTIESELRESLGRQLG